MKKLKISGEVLILYTNDFVQVYKIVDKKGAGILLKTIKLKCE